MTRKKPLKGAKRQTKQPLQYLMKLYVTGATPRSSAAILNLRKVCDEYLPGRYKLKIIDIYQQPKLAREAGLIAAPTLVKSFPLPFKKFIGDMSNKANLLLGLEIKPVPSAKSSRKG